MSLRYKVNKCVSLFDLLKKLGYSWDKLPAYLCCPFHDDSNPSAKLFPDGKLMCFRCGRQYDAYDCLTIIFGKTEEDLRKVFLNVDIKGSNTVKSGLKGYDLYIKVFDSAECRKKRDDFANQKILIDEYIRFLFDYVRKVKSGS